MNPHDVAAELRERAEKARVRGSRIAARTGRADYQEGKADGLDEAASLVESAARVDPDLWCSDEEAQALTDAKQAVIDAMGDGPAPTQSSQDARVDPWIIGNMQGVESMIRMGFFDPEKVADAISEWVAALEPAPPTLKGEDDGAMYPGRAGRRPGDPQPGRDGMTADQRRKSIQRPDDKGIRTRAAAGQRAEPDVRLPERLEKGADALAQPAASTRVREDDEVR